MDNKETLIPQTKNKNDIKALFIHVTAAVYAFLIFAFNFSRIFDNNFWGDEAYSINLIRKGLIPILTETASDVHPPLYYLLLMALYRVFGARGWVYHFAAIIPFAAVLIFAVTFFYKRFGKEAAFILITLVGFSDNAAIYNVEVRMYSLAFMFVLFSYYSLYRILEDEKNAWIFFVIFSLGAAYTHYYALLTVGFFYLSLLIFTIRKKIELKRFLLICGCTIAGYLPWAVKFLSTFGRTTGSYWMTEVPGIKDIIKYFFLAENKWYSYGMLALTFIMLGFFIYKDRFLTEKSTWLICGVAATLGTVIMGVAVSYAFRPVFTLRFIYPAVSLVWVILAVSISGLKPGKILAPVVVCLSLFFYVPVFMQTCSYERAIDEIRSDTEAVINVNVESGDLIITNGEHLDWTILDYYVPRASHMYSENLNAIPAHTGTTYLFWTDPLTDEEKAVLKLGGKEAVPVMENGLIGNWVRIYRLDPL